MPEIYTAFASEVKVNEETLEGLQAIDYKVESNREHVGAIGTNERIAVYFGMRVVVGHLRVASANKTLDGFMQSNKEFTISATLKHGDTTRHVTFDNCFMEDKQFDLSSQSHGETVYSFTATRVREE
jgi:hypothetical protein